MFPTATERTAPAASEASAPDAIVGRDREWTWLQTAVDAARAGAGGFVLLGGEAGVGKTRLAEEVLGAADALFLRGGANPSAPPPYGPVVGAIRSHLHTDPNALEHCGPLRSHLAVLLPELGAPAQDSDRATLFESIRCALAAIATERPALVLLDDLQWSDDATLELLGGLAPALAELPVLVVGAYRSDEIPRTHPIRRLRSDLRRGRALHELALEPLDVRSTAMLVERALGGTPSDALRRTLQDRTQGVPFFIEELAAALVADDRIVVGPAGLELVEAVDVPVPETIRDAVLLRASGLSDAACAASEAAAVAGSSFDLELVAGLSNEVGFTELMEVGLITETRGGTAAFRHALVRDALYENVPWLRRRVLHRQLAEALEARGESGAALAPHWLGGREIERALDALTQATEDLCNVHAYGDAARAARQALDVWPEGERAAERVVMLERYAHCAELTGDLAEAVRAWREVAVVRRSAGAGRALANAERRLASVYELDGDRNRAIAARTVAANAFAAIGLPGEAATERLAAAAWLQSQGHHSQAIDVIGAAREEARRAERTDLQARGMALEGMVRAKRGEVETGLNMARSGLSLALEHQLTTVAAESYHRLGAVLEQAAEYGSARDVFDTAVGFCRASGAAELEHACLTCMVYVLRELGEWRRSEALCRDLDERDAGPTIAVAADGILGSIHAFRGEVRHARPLLERCLGVATQIDLVSMQLDATASLAWLEDQCGAHDAAAGHCRFLLERWERSDDRHYAISGLRWAACFFANRGDGIEARACADALARIAADSGQRDALAALAHALGEVALLEGDPSAATEQIGRALDLQAMLDIPFARAQILLRAGVVHRVVGDREIALERLEEAHRMACKLGSRPLASRAAAEIADLGESLESRLGRRAATRHEGAGLSPRELEVVRLVAVGRTNREIARELFLSPRTVDMHVRNILGKLSCRSRMQAASEAAKLGLLG